MEVPIDVPVEVTRVVTEAIGQQIVAAPTPAPASACAPATPEQSSVVTIGAILPLSSPGAMLAGFAMQTALNIALTDINEQGGIHDIPIRLVTYDSAGTAERSAHFTERLILLDCAVGIVGLYHSAEALAASDIAHRYGIPMIVAEAGADDITARGYPEIFRLAPSHSMLAQRPASWLAEVGDYNKDGALTTTLLADNSTKGNTYMEAVLGNLHASDIAADVLYVDLPSTDFSAVIARLLVREQLPDAIFITLKGDPALRLQSQLLLAGISPQRSTLIVQHHAGLDSAQFWSTVPDGAGTVVARIGAWPSTLSERGQEFAIKYDQYMGRWPEHYAFASYDAMWLLATALRDAPSWRGSDLIATLEQANIDLAGGNISFAVTSLSPAGAGQPPYLWHQWTGSDILYLQYAEANQPADTMAIIYPPHLRAPTLQTAVISLLP